VILFWSEVSYVEVLGAKVQCTLGWLYCDYFIWCVSCTVVVLTCFVICGVCMCGFFSMWVCVCMGVLVICVLVFTVFLYCFVYVYLFFLCFCIILQVMYFYCYFYVFLLLCMFCSIYSVFIVPTCTLRLPGLRFFHAFSSVVRQMPGCNSQRGEDGAQPTLFPN